MKFTIEDPREVNRWFEAVVRTADPATIEMPYFRGSLLGQAQRAIFVADEANERVGFALITNYFSKYRLPAILATYTLPGHRGRGYGKGVTVEAINTLTRDTGSAQVVVEIETQEGLALCTRLPREFLAKLDFYDPEGTPLSRDGQPLPRFNPLLRWDILADNRVVAYAISDDLFHQLHAIIRESGLRYRVEQSGLLIEESWVTVVKVCEGALRSIRL